MYDRGEHTRNSDGQSLDYFLQQAYDYGAEFFVDGEAVLPHELIRRAVREEESYMADYIPDNAGGIAQVRLNKVKKQ
ncbi:MAG: hypothetical protein IJ833_00650 [Lachnospiraceae bacterium]|nr:hypothetical protein [Lachnospiraceae bacterium]